MARLSETFLAKVKESYPDAPTGIGWQRALARDLQNDPGRAINQTMISKIASFSTPKKSDAKPPRRAIEIDTIVKVRNYTGVSLEELLGLDVVRSNYDDALADALRRLADVEAKIGATDSGTRRRK